MAEVVDSSVEREAFRLARWVRITPYDVVRVLLAVILLVAAGLKGHQLATEPILGKGLLDSRWLLMATVEFELFYGLWLLAGLLPRLTWAVALGCFSLFASVSLYKALSGAASCGCFGLVEVNPWYTFALDTVAVLALLRCRPANSTAVSSTIFFTHVFFRATAVALTWFSIGLPAALAMAHYQPTILAADGVILGNDDLVVLEPIKWIGKRFPLLEYIDISGQLETSRWLVLLYHNDCQKCQEMILWARELVQQRDSDPMCPRLAMIEVLPHGELKANLPLSLDTNCVWGSLDNTVEWFVETPAVLFLDDGIVCKPAGDWGPDVMQFRPEGG